MKKLFVLFFNKCAKIREWSSQHRASSDIIDYRELRKFESQEEMVATLAASSRATGVEMHGVEAQNGNVTEYYMMPAIDDDPTVGQLNYTNDNETSTFDAVRFPKNYKIISVYHTHLTSNGPNARDSYNSYYIGLNSGKSFVIALGSNTVWQTTSYFKDLAPKVLPIQQTYFGMPLVQLMIY